MITAVQELEDSLRGKKVTKGLALLGGADTPQLPFGWIPVELTSALRAEGYLVAGWGDAALWMIKNGFASEGQDHAARILEEYQGPLLALKAFAVSGRLENFQGICFTGLKACRDLAVALGLAGLGLKVCVAVPLPLWGSERVRNFLADKPIRSLPGFRLNPNCQSPETRDKNANRFWIAFLPLRARRHVWVGVM